VLKFCWALCNVFTEIARIFPLKLQFFDPAIVVGRVLYTRKWWVSSDIHKSSMKPVSSSTFPVIFLQNFCRAGLCVVFGCCRICVSEIPTGCSTETQYWRVNFLAERLGRFMNEAVIASTFLRFGNIPRSQTSPDVTVHDVFLWAYFRKQDIYHSTNNNHRV